MKKEYQVTLKATNGKYKPVSAVVTLDEGSSSKDIIREGVRKICQKRLWTQRELQQYTYTRAVFREYDKEKIAKENAERYERVKEEKYASGEWKRPKKVENRG